MKNKGGGKGSKAGAGGRGQPDRVKGKKRYVFSFVTILFTH